MIFDRDERLGVLIFKNYFSIIVQGTTSVMLLQVLFLAVSLLNKVLLYLAQRELMRASQDVAELVPHCGFCLWCPALWVTATELSLGGTGP